MTALLSFAHDFEVKNVDGKTIYYNITSSSDLTVAVTYQGTFYSEYIDEYTGSVTIPEKVTYNGKPYSVTSIGGSAFSRCSGLTSITIPNSVTSIGDWAFSYCSGLTSIEIPNSVTSIGSSAFYGCSGLTSIEIPNSVTSIGEGAFWNCSGLTSIEIPNSVTSIGDGVFSDCSGLTSIVVEKGNTKYDSRNNCNAIIETASNTLICGCKTTVIPSSVTSIGNSAFRGCSGLTSIEIPNNVTSISSFAFQGCIGLTSVTIPNSVTSIGGYAFSDCRFLKSITIPNSVTTIGWSAFSGCSGLTSVTIPNDVTSIGSAAFSGCSGLTSIVVEKGNTKYDSRNNCNAIIETASNTLIRGCNTTVIPNSVTAIGGGAFLGCSSLTSVTIPNSVTSIGDGAFSECSGLTSITIPNSVTSIGYYAFYNCSSLTSVIIPNSVTSIGSYAFKGCSGLTSVTIPNSVTSIGTSAFSECTGLTSVSIPNSVTVIDEMTFEDCSSLTSITIPSSVTIIGQFAFYGCSSLTSITIPSSVTIISDFAFRGCSSLKEITSYIQEPFQTGDYCWNLVNKSIPLYVPAGSKEKYQITGGWKDFTNIIEFGGERIEPLTEPQEVDVAVVPDQISLNGMVVGDTYYVLDADNGDGADSENGCVVINTTTTEEAVDGIAGKDVSDASVKAAFKGIIFMVPAGTGTISITAETLGTSSLMVKIGSQAAQAFQLAERETVEIPYSVAEPTYVYIYAGTGTQAARSVGAARAAAAENSVKVYSYKWEPADPAGINSLDNSQSATGNEAGDWYTIDGRKLSGKPVQKGIYIVNGRKVAVK